MQYLHICKITEIEPGKKLTYSWQYDSYPGESFVTWELFSEGSKTKVKLTHADLETFQQDNKGFAIESFLTGWTHIVGKSLAEYVEKT